uniref:Putative disease resistance protein 1-1 n=1 Tax=Populus ussuriensis TaxID=696360 RepID=A0A5B8HWW3_9ROSI|nr:putative disease resistance protein 1-1 [Populus ussuriensis]
MAMIAVQVVLEKLASFVAEETRFLGGVRGGIVELQDDLYSMKSFLQDAEERSEGDQGLRAWFMFRFAPSHGSGFIHYLHNSYRSIRKLSARHQLAVQLQSIKARVKAISERRNAFSLNRIDMPSTSGATVEKWHDPRLAALYLDEADIVGIENPKHLLVSWLEEGEEKLSSISVVGMGGLGKTTLVKKVYDSHRIRRSFDTHSWVTVSKSFASTELLRVALQGFLVTANEPVPDNLRYVIVLDDVWNVNAWETIKYAFPDCNCGSRIIFTTRLSNLAESIENTSHVYELQALAENEAWTLFCMKAFRGEHKAVCPPELEEMSRNILKKCEGLPLAIVAIGGLLSKKKNGGLEWKKVHDCLATELKSNDDLGSLRRILQLSYDNLPYYLKQCYLYLSVFPEDYLIKRMKLIWLWIVERFVEEKQGFTMEEVAEEYLNELVNRSLIQVVEMNYFNRVKTCRVHDLMREIIQMKSREESFVMIANGTRISKNEKVRRLSIHENSEEVQSDMRFRYLWSLLSFSSHHSFEYGFRNYKLLRVLNLDRAPLSTFLPELAELIHLRYLSLRWTMISELPESIRKLKCLEILDLKRSPVSSLPAGITQLTCLCQLRNYRYIFQSSSFFPDTHGMRVPSGIGRLTSLQKLGSVEVNEDYELVRELGKLTQLRRLGILKLREEQGMDLCYTLDRLKHLTALYLVSLNNTEFLQFDSLSSPPKYLQRLNLKCSLPALPGWIASLQYISKLVLQYSNLKSDPLKVLQKLPSLVMLELCQAYAGEELCCDPSGFSKLKRLGLHELERLRRIRIAKGSMPGLERLDITACTVLETVPDGIENLKNIEDLVLWYMPSTFIKTIERHRGEDFWRVQHITTITRIYESQGRRVSETLL